MSRAQLFLFALWMGAACLIAVAQKPELVVQTGHTEAVLSTAFSPDGKILASGSSDNTVKLWDVASGKELHTLRGMRDASFVAFSSNGRILATGGQDQVLRLWDTVTLTLMASVNTGSRMKAVTFSPDGRVLATANLDKAIHLWSVPGCAPIGVLEGHDGDVLSIAFSRDGRTLISGGADSKVKIWDVASRHVVRPLSGHTSSVDQVFISPDGKTAFSKSESDGVFNFTAWDVTAGTSSQPLYYREAEPARKHPIGLSLDTAQMAAAEENGESFIVRLREARTGKEIRPLRDPGGPFCSFAFAPDGKTLAGGGCDGTLKFWDVSTGNELHAISGHAETMSSVAFSPGGTLLATAGTDQKITLWNLSSGKETTILAGHARRILSLAFSPDGRLLASASHDNTVKIWDVSTAKETATFVYRPGEVDDSRISSVSAAFSSDAKILAVGSWEPDSVRFWDLTTNQEIFPIKNPHLPVKKIAFMPDGRTLIIGATASTPIHLWDIQTGEEIPIPTHQRGEVALLAERPDGKMLASVDVYGRMEVLELINGKDWRTVAERQHGGVEIAFSSGNLALVHDGGMIEVLDVRDWKDRQLGPTSDSIRTVAFHPNGAILASAGQGPRIRLWDMRNGRELLSLFSFPDGTWAVVDPEGRYDASEAGHVEWLHWMFNNEVIDLSQLKERYYEPGLLSKALGFNKEPRRDVEAFTDPKLYPQVHVVAPDAAHPKLGIHLNNQGGGIGRVEVLINGKEAEVDARKDSVNTNAQQLDLDVDVAHHPFLKPGEKNVVQVRAYNAEGYLVSRGVTTEYKPPGEKLLAKPSLWAIVAGTSDYAGAELHLQFAAKDAADMALALRMGAERLFGKAQAHVTLLTTAKTPGALPPTRENLKNAFAEVARQAKSTDVLVVYLSGHGVNYGGQGSEEADYYYLTQEARSGDLTDTEVRRQTSVSSKELTDWIKQIPALKQVLVLDTCAAARLVEKLTEKRDVPSSQIRSLERMKDRMGLYILAGSAADAVSYETSRYGQGLLTYSLLLGMKGESLRENQFVDVNTWFAFAADKVPQLAKDIGGIQRPDPAIPYGGASFDVGQLLDEDKVRISLAGVRPLFLQSNFQDEARPIDALKLTPRVNEVLRGVSARGKDADLGYVDASDFPEAYLVAGRYHVEGSSVTVKVTLFQGATEQGHFTVEGNPGDLDSVAAKIVSGAERLLQNSPGKTR